MKLHRKTGENATTIYDLDVLSLLIRNNSTDSQKINVLSNFLDKNENCKFDAYGEEEVYDYIKEKLKSNTSIFKKLRILTSDLNQFQNHVYVINRHHDGGASIIETIYPLAHIRPTQFQSSIVDVIIPLRFDGNTELETELINSNSISLVLLNENGYSHANFNDESMDRLSWIPISIENPTDEEIELNLNFDDKHNPAIDDRLKIIFADGVTSFDFFCKSLISERKYIEFKSLHFINNAERLMKSTIRYSFGDKTIPFSIIDTFSQIQFQTNFIEFLDSHPVNSSNSENKENLKINLPAKTKIIFFVMLKSM